MSRVRAWPLLALSLAGCGGGEPAAYERTFPVPLAEARTLMATAELPQLVFGQDEVRQSVAIGDPARIVYFVGKEGAEVMHFTATTSAVEPNATQVKVVLSGPTTGKYVTTNQRLAEKPRLKAFYETAMGEAIAAKLERREYNLTVAYPDMMGAVFENAPNLAANIKAVEEASKKQTDEAFEKAYGKGH